MYICPSFQGGRHLIYPQLGTIIIMYGLYKEYSISYMYRTYLPNRISFICLELEEFFEALLCVIVSLKDISPLVILLLIQSKNGE